MALKSVTRSDTWSKKCIINLSLHGLAVNMARHCIRVKYFPSPVARENTLHTRTIFRHIDRWSMQWGIYNYNHSYNYLLLLIIIVDVQCIASQWISVQQISALVSFNSPPPCVYQYELWQHIIIIITVFRHNKITHCVLANITSLLSYCHQCLWHWWQCGNRRVILPLYTRCLSCVYHVTSTAACMPLAAYLPTRIKWQTVDGQLVVVLPCADWRSKVMDGDQPLHDVHVATLCSKMQPRVALGIQWMNWTSSIVDNVAYNAALYGRRRQFMHSCKIIIIAVVLRFWCSFSYDLRFHE